MSALQDKAQTPVAPVEDNQDYKRIQSARCHIIHDPSLPAELVARLHDDLDGVIADAVMLKNDIRTTVVRVDHETRSYVVKRYNLRGPVHTALHWLQSSRAARSWRASRQLRSARLLTPRPLLALEERRGPLRLRSALVTDHIKGRTLEQVLKETNDDEAVEPIRRQLSILWTTLRQLRLRHGDMKAPNFIVDDDGRMWFIDLDGMRHYPRGPLYERARRRDVESFMHFWREHPDVQARFRDVFSPR